MKKTKTPIFKICICTWQIINVLYSEITEMIFNFDELDYQNKLNPKLLIKKLLDEIFCDG